MSEQGNTTDQPGSNLNQESVTSFHDRAMRRLGSDPVKEPDSGSESEIPAESNEQERYEDFRQDREPEAHQPDEGYPEESETQTDQPTGSLAEGVDDSDTVETDEHQDDQDETPDKLRQRVTEAENNLQSMQRDYTQKTQKLGESRKELLNNLEKSRKVAQAYVERASTQLQRYANVNWQQLQSTLDPKTYNQREAEYRQVVGVRNRAVAEHEQIVKFAQEQIESAKTDQAEISRDVLLTTVPGWGNELYGTIREHAVSNLGWTSEEFDEITDHRVIRLIHGDLNISNSGRTVRQIQQGAQAKRPGGANKQQSRGADGKFRNAQQAHLQNPGNKTMTRTAFQERLRREREGRR